MLYPTLSQTGQHVTGNSCFAIAVEFYAYAL
jgi:hypothetical protein